MGDGGDPYSRLGLSLEGQAYLPNASRQIAARLLTRAPQQGEGGGPDDLIVGIVDAQTGEALVAAPLSEITVDPPLGSAPRKLHFPDRTAFETEDRAGVVRLTGATRGDLLDQYEKFHPRLFGVVAVLLVCGYVIWRWGLDILVSAAIALTPQVMIEQLDRGTLQTIDFLMAEETEMAEAERDRVHGIFSDIVAALPADQVNAHGFELLFRNMEDVGPNAFALPGGTVIMTDQFVDMFPEDDVIAGVLGHEVGHVVEQHGLRQTYRSLGAYILIGFLAGETGPFLEEMLLEGNLLLSLSYSRSHEAAADEFGVKLSSDAGYNPDGLKLFFERVQEIGVEPTEWLSTHPNSENRVEQIEGYIRALD